MVDVEGIVAQKPVYSKLKDIDKRRVAHLLKSEPDLSQVASVVPQKVQHNLYRSQSSDCVQHEPTDQLISELRRNRARTRIMGFLSSVESLDKLATWPEHRKSGDWHQMSLENIYPIHNSTSLTNICFTEFNSNNSVSRLGSVENMFQTSVSDRRLEDSAERFVNYCQV